MKLRRGTQDEREYERVLLGNEYQLPDSFGLGDTVIDVGAQIGCFALACLTRGAAHVYCIEPEPSNLELLELNLEPYRGQYTILRGAVWENGGDKTIRLWVRPRPYTAMHSVSDTGLAVYRIDLDALIRDIGEVHTLKLDCEGAEYPALYRCLELGNVLNIVGESHRLAGPERLRLAFDGHNYEEDHAGLISFLSQHGFRCRVAPNSPDMPHQNKLFWATR